MNISTQYSVIPALPVIPASEPESHDSGSFLDSCLRRNDVSRICPQVTLTPKPAFVIPPPGLPVIPALPVIYTMCTLLPPSAKTALREAVASGAPRDSWAVPRLWREETPEALP